MGKGNWQYFDLKGVGSQRMKSQDEAREEEIDIVKEPGAIMLDAGFEQALKGLPLPLSEGEYERLIRTLSADTRILGEAGLVDYSMMVAMRRADPDRGACIRLGLIDYLQP